MDDSSLGKLTPVELDIFAQSLAERIADRLENRRRLLTRRELAEVINVSVPKLDTMLRDDHVFPVIRVGRKVLFDPHAVIKHLSKSTKIARLRNDLEN